MENKAFSFCDNQTRMGEHFLGVLPLLTVGVLKILFDNPCNNPHCNIAFFINMCHNKGHLIFLYNGAAVVATVSDGVDSQF